MIEVSVIFKGMFVNEIFENIILIRPVIIRDIFHEITLQTPIYF